MPSITGTSSRGNVFRKNSGPTLARSSFPRHPGAYALLGAFLDPLLDPPLDPPFEELLADDAGLCDGFAERWVGRLAG